MITVYLNGEYVPRERALVSVDDRGFVFGDGIYEGVRAIDGRLFEWPAHADRMVEGLAGLRIDFGAQRVAEFPAICDRLLRDNQLTTGDGTVFVTGTGPACVSRTETLPRRGSALHKVRLTT